MKKQEKEKENRQEHPLRAMARFGWRPTFTALLLSAQAITTTFFVSQIGVAAVATIAIAVSILSIPRYIYLSVGSAVRYFTANAKDNNAEAVKYIVQGAFQACFLALVLGGGTAVLAGQLLRFYMDDFISDGVLYLQIVGGASFLPALFGVLSNGLKAWDRKEQKITTRAGQTMCLSCIPLDGALIYLLDFGLIGAACTVVLTNTLGTVWLFKRFLSKAGSDLQWKVDWEIQKRVFGQAFAIMPGDMANQAVMVFYFHIVASTGTDSLAAVSTLYTVQGFVYLPWMRGIIETIHLVVNPKDTTEQVARYIRWTLSTVAFGTFVVWLILLVIAEPVVGFITDDADVINLTVWLVLLYSLVQAPWAIYACVGEVLGMRLQAKTSSIIFTSSSVLFAIACWKLPKTLEAVSWAEVLQYSFMAITSVVYLCGLFKAEGVYLFPIRATVVKTVACSWNLLRTFLGLLKVHFGRLFGTHVFIQRVPKELLISEYFPDYEPVYNTLKAYHAIDALASLKKFQEGLPLENAMLTAKNLLHKHLAEIGQDQKLQRFLAEKTGAHWPQNRDPGVAVQKCWESMVKHAEETAVTPETPSSARCLLRYVRMCMPKLGDTEKIDSTLRGEEATNFPQLLPNMFAVIQPEEPRHLTAWQ